ncbi:MAG TPA: hypothetical protein VFQ53_13590 [Kofleriaceae bacterium]|nr:hypothetical protein [Kofleriaceae bacterium]
MKDLVLATSLVVFATGCSDEADIGVDSQPMQCLPNNEAVVTVGGRVTNPYDTSQHFDFDSATAVARQYATQSALRLDTPAGPNDVGLVLQFGFYCAPAEIAQYDVVADGQQGLDCPFQVASAVLGRIEYLPAESGVMIVDESSNCLAGRFRADFGEFGAIGGSFSVPWTFAQ